MHCDKTFRRISSLQRHVRSHDAAPGHKTKRTPFLCTVCGKNFPFSNGVQRHMRTHFGIRNHECEVCHRKFTQSTHLRVHMRTHTGEKPYICETCGETFALNASLQKHLATHVKEDVNYMLLPAGLYWGESGRRLFVETGTDNLLMLLINLLPTGLKRCWYFKDIYLVCILGYLRFA